MISLSTLRTPVRPLLTSVSLLLVGAALATACTMPSLSKSGSSTVAKPAPAAQSPAKPVAPAQAAAKPAANQPAATAETVMLHNDAKLGSFLTDGKGMTLYVYAKDSTDKSTCTADCLKTWLPYTVADANAKLSAAPNVTGKLSVIKRDDGKFQVAYDGMPLYYFTQDKQVGDLHGQGQGNDWWLFSVAGKPITTKTT